MSRPKACAGCPSCTTADRREKNFDRTRATQVSVVCVDCGVPVTATVGYMLAARGLIHCPRHGGPKAVR